MPTGLEQTSGLVVASLMADAPLIALFGDPNSKPEIFYGQVPAKETYPFIFIQRADNVELNPTSENDACHTQEDFTFVAFMDDPDVVWAIAERIRAIFIPSGITQLPTPLLPTGANGNIYDFTTRITSQITSMKTPFKSQRSLPVYQAALSILFSSIKLGGV